MTYHVYIIGLLPLAGVGEFGGETKGGINVDTIVFL
jgi:hypothetical protein